MKDGNFGHNGSDLDKASILKPTFDTVMRRVARRSKPTAPILKSSSFCVAR
jgi:hypothetical protein